MKPWDAKELCDMMRKMPGWIEKGRIHVPGYGKQTVFIRTDSKGQ